jgi:hypothetical protein
MQRDKYTLGTSWPEKQMCVQFLIAFTLVLYIASSWNKWLEWFENCLDAIDIGADIRGKGLLLNSTGL